MNKILNQQKRIVNFFHRQERKKMVSHAYLLNGEKTDDLSRYMAMSLLCEEQEEGACFKCDNCNKVLLNEHASLSIINPDNERIKKDDIIDLKIDLSQTALEENQKRVYIINEVDKATPQALNSLLKFLEEPSSDITAILSTNSLNRVLDTIISRCLVLTLDDVSLHDLKEKALEEAYDEKMIDALLPLSQNYEELQSYLDSNIYHTFFDSINDFLLKYKRDKVEASALLNANLINTLKLDLNQFSEYLIMMFELSDDYDLKEIISNIQDRIRPGVNVKLLIDQFTYFLSIKEIK